MRMFVAHYNKFSFWQVIHIHDSVISCICFPMISHELDMNVFIDFYFL